MKINVDEGNALKAFINVAGTKADTPVDEVNTLTEAFIAKFNAGELSVTAFKGRDGKIVIGFK